MADLVTQTTAWITAALHVHLNIGQKSTSNTSSSFLSLETLTLTSLANKRIQPVANAAIHLPPDLHKFTSDNTVSLQSTMQRLAPADRASPAANTNLSTSISLAILDSAGRELDLSTSVDHPFEFIIPRDSTLAVPPMNLQNVTSSATPHHRLFNLHHVDIKQSTHLTVSLHLDLHPLDATLSYLLIHRFDQAPQLNRTTNAIDGWSLLCFSSSLSSSLERWSHIPVI